ncbi:MAG: hypothetical protein ACRCTT_11195 [Enterobacter roggenkampii]
MPDEFEKTLMIANQSANPNDSTMSFPEQDNIDENPLTPQHKKRRKIKGDPYPVITLFLIICMIALASYLLFGNEPAFTDTAPSMDKPVTSWALSQLIAERDQLNDPAFNQAIRTALADNVITYRELGELNQLARDITYQRKIKTLKGVSL